MPVVEMETPAHLDRQTVTKTPRDKRFLPLRIVLLATLMFGFNAWCIRHLATDLREIAMVNAFLAFIGITLGWIEEREAGQIRASMKAVLIRLLDGQVIVSLYLVALVGTSFFASVTVIADGHNGSSTLHLTTEGSERCRDCKGDSLEGPSGVVSYFRWTNIFGRPFYLEASGYQRKSFTLYPWTGATISLSADLVQLPSIVLRIPYSLHSSLEGGKLVVDFGQPQGSFEIPMRKGRASAQLGPVAAIPEHWRNEWRSEVRTLPGTPASLQEEFFRNWLNPIRNEAMPSPAPAQQLLITFVTRAEKVELQQTFTVGREPFQEIILILED